MGKAILNGLKKAWAWLKSWFVKAGPALQAEAAAAPAQASRVWGWLKAIGAGFKVVGKALISLKFWVYLTIIALFAAEQLAVFVVGHGMGHRAVPGLMDSLASTQENLADSAKQVKSLTDKVTSLQAELAAAKKPDVGGAKQTGNAAGKKAPSAVKKASAKPDAAPWYSGILP